MIRPSPFIERNLQASDPQSYGLCNHFPHIGKKLLKEMIIDYIPLQDLTQHLPIIPFKLFNYLIIRLKNIRVILSGPIIPGTSFVLEKAFIPKQYLNLPLQRDPKFKTKVAIAVFYCFGH